MFNLFLNQLYQTVHFFTTKKGRKALSIKAFLIFVNLLIMCCSGNGKILISFLLCDDK